MVSKEQTTEKTFPLQVITPDRAVFKGEVKSVKLPAHDGYLGILYHHAPMIAILGTGVLTVNKGEGFLQSPPSEFEGEIFVSNGFVQVDCHGVRVVCDEGEGADKIDLEKALAAEKRARERLAESLKAGVDRSRAYAALRRSILRQRLVEKRRRRSPTGIR